MHVSFTQDHGVLVAALTPSPEDPTEPPEGKPGPRLAGNQAVFHVPPGWRLEDAHADLLALAAFHLVRPFTRSSLTLSHAVSPAFAETVKRLFRITIAPTDPALQPRRSPGGQGSPGLAFSGGADSTAAVAVMPADTKLFYLDRISPSGAPPQRSLFDKSAAVHACDMLSASGRTVVRLPTDLEYIRGPIGFPTDLAAAVPVILLADSEQLTAVGWGTIAESAYRIGTTHFIDYAERGMRKSWSALYEAVGLPFLNAVAGVSEVGTSSIIRSAGFSEIAQSCIRGRPGDPCLNCWKCYRKTLLDSALSGEWPSYDVLDRLFSIREATRFLAKVPIKHEDVLTFALSQNPPEHPMLDLLRRRVQADILDPQWLKRTYGPALNLLPDHYREVVRGRLAEHLDPMDASDEEAFRSWDLRPLSTDPKYLALAHELKSGLDVRTRSMLPSSVRRTAVSLRDKAAPAAARFRGADGAVTAPPASGTFGRRRILFMSSNGAGMGHLTRLLAMARRVTPTTQPVFFSLSQAVSVVGDEGYPFEFFPSRDYLRNPARHWNRMLQTRLDAILRWHGPEAVVFDGIYPYLGLMLAKDQHPDIPFVWSRRGMWKNGVNTDGLLRSSDFDLVLEPGDLAAAYDSGPTSSRGDAVRVPPVTYLDESELVSREEACEALGLDPSRRAALVTLGAGNINDTTSDLRTTLRAIKQVTDFQVCVTHTAIAGAGPEASDALVVSQYPLSRYLRAFDFAVSASGYNSFHELVGFAVPSVYLPNMKTATDDQHARARFAQEQGLGVCVTEVDDRRMIAAVGQIADAGEQMVERCRQVHQENGAGTAIRAVEALIERAPAQVTT